MPTCGAHILGFCVFAENCSRFHAGSCSCALKVVDVHSGTNICHLCIPLIFKMITMGHRV